MTVSSPLPEAEAGAHGFGVAGKAPPSSPEDALPSNDPSRAPARMTYGAVSIVRRTMSLVLCATVTPAAVVTVTAIRAGRRLSFTYGLACSLPAQLP